jgi:hypothetical protein
LLALAWHFAIQSNITKLTSLWAGFLVEMLVKLGYMLYNAVNRLPALRPSNDCRLGDSTLLLVQFGNMENEMLVPSF